MSLSNHTFNRQFVDEDKGGPWRFRNKFDGSVPLRGHVDTSIPCGSQVCLLTIKSKVAAENNDTRYTCHRPIFPAFKSGFSGVVGAMILKNPVIG